MRPRTLASDPEGISHARIRLPASRRRHQCGIWWFPMIFMSIMVMVNDPQISGALFEKQIMIPFQTFGLPFLACFPHISGVSIVMRVPKNGSNGKSQSKMDDENRGTPMTWETSIWHGLADVFSPDVAIQVRGGINQLATRLDTLKVNSSMGQLQFLPWDCHGFFHDLSWFLLVYPCFCWLGDCTIIINNICN